MTTINVPAEAPGSLIGEVTKVDFDGPWLVSDTFTAVGVAGVLAIKCLSCGGGFAIDTDIGARRQTWPLPNPATPEYVPPKVAEAFEDACKALNAGATLAACIMARTTLDRAKKEQGVKDYKDFDISPALVDSCASLWAFGNATAHDDMSVDDANELAGGLVEQLRAVLENLYSIPARAKEQEALMNVVMRKLGRRRKD